MNFLQIYGLVLNFDLTIEWPYAWADFQKFFAWLPSILILDFDYIFRFQFGIQVNDDQIAYITFFATILTVFSLVILYRFFSSLRKDSFLTSNVEHWGKRKCCMFFVWLSLLILTLIIIVVSEEVLLLQTAIYCW